MKISQKILLPTLSVFFFVIASLFAYSFIINQVTDRNRENTDHAQLEAAFDSKVKSQGDLALGLALQAANDPSIQEAFALRDRQRLTDLTYTTYQTLNRQFDLPQYQYHLAPAISFLRLHDLDSFGDDLSAFRKTVMQANLTKLPVVGLEVGRGGLGLRAVTPVFYNGTHIGSLEFGSNVDDTFLKSLKAEYGHEWRILLTREALDTATLQDLATLTPGPTTDLYELAATSELSFAPASFYASILEEGLKSTSTLRTIENNTFRIYSFPLLDYSGETIGTVELITDLGPTLNQQFLRIFFSVVAVLIALGLGSYTLMTVTRRTLQPLGELTQSAMLISSGDLNHEIKVSREQDEIGQLGRAFSQMTLQLRNLIDSLEKSIRDRTRDLERRTRELETASRIARDIASEQRLDQLLTNAANLIHEEFHFYHVGIFLVDDLREYAVLRASTGDAGRQMLALNHRLKVGEVGIVGFVTQTGRPRVALEVSSDLTHFRNPLLPNTRSEMALPLAYGSDIIGALDVQSTEAGAFDENDVKIIQTLADQLAIAINNARLAERAQDSLRELGTLYQSQIRNAWKQVAQERLTEFEYDGLNILSTSPDLPEGSLDQLAGGRPVILRSQTLTKKGAPGSILLLPLMLQGQLLGTVGIEKSDPAYEWSTEELSVAENATAQASLALENARLLEETQRRAAKERTIGEISARIGGLVDIEKILQTTVQELSQTLPNAEVAIQFQHKERG
ncbi:MAG: GAF domain-containing protein [Chloroflexi bacterium]|nr:GAF domain-containing protein [Chloroflexota bacterium]